MKIPPSLRRALRGGCLCLLLPLAGNVTPFGANPEPEGETRAVDIVICLDTSWSMEDLLDSTRARIWDVVRRPERSRGVVPPGPAGPAHVSVTARS